MTDYELVQDIQENNTKDSIELLWKRYQPMIGKHWGSVAARFKNFISLEMRNDFFQDAFFQMTTAIHKTDLSRVEADGWKFIGMYWYFLKKLSSKYRKRIIRDIDNTVIAPFEALDNPQKVDGAFLTIAESTYDNPMFRCFDPVKMTFDKELIVHEKLFRKSLSSEQTYILEACKQGIKTPVIGKEIGRNSMHVYRQIYRMKEIASAVFDVDYVNTRKTKV